MTSQSFPVLEHPPIVEVVCGIAFEPLDLDGMVLGIYWDGRKNEFPDRSLQPAYSDEPEVILGNPPLRAVLVSRDKVRLLQLQHDRFFMNWRATGEAYPRFSGGPMRAVRIQTRAVLQVGSDTDLDQAFTKANESVNGVFFTLLKKEELKRFRTAG